MAKLPRFAVIGGGNGGKSMSADLAARGFAVTLYNRTGENIQEIIDNRIIDLVDDENGEFLGCRLTLATADMAEALADADVVMVALPATAHRDVARSCARHLRDGQIVVLNPGRTGGALEFGHILDQQGCSADVIVAESNTFIFACRSTSPTAARIFGRKNHVPLAALRPEDTQTVLDSVCKAYPQFVFAPSVLHTSLDNHGAVLHPATVLLNTGWVEHTDGNFLFYHDSVTPSVAHVLEAIDQERMNIAAALGVDVRSTLKWFQDAYLTEKDTLYEAIQATYQYREIRATPSMDHRFVFDDVPFSLVPMASLGAQVGVNTGMIDAVIRIANVVHGKNYYEVGRTVEDMGLVGLNPDEIANYVTNGATSIDNMLRNRLCAT